MKPLQHFMVWHSRIQLYTAKLLTSKYYLRKYDLLIRASRDPDRPNELKWPSLLAITTHYWYLVLFFVHRLTPYHSLSLGLRGMHAGGVLGRRAASSLLPKWELMIK